MSETISIPMPTLAAVAAMDGPGFQVRVTWAESLRPRPVEIVDLSPLINSFKILRPLRKDKALFRSVEVVEDGDAIGWGNDEDLQIAATAIERLADESMSAHEFLTFIENNGMTHAEAAAALGYGRRQVESYLSGSKPIPRVVALACYGYDAKQQRAKLGIALRSGTHGRIGARSLTQTRANVRFNISGTASIDVEAA